MSGEERECFQLEYQTRLEAGGAGRDLDMVRPHTGELSPAEKHSTGEGEGRAGYDFLVAPVALWPVIFAEENRILPLS